MDNILITGSNGQLGNELKMLNDEFLMLNYKCFFTDRNSLDITDFKKVKSFCIENKITHIVNCAAYTAVDKAEEDKELADRINHLAVKYLAQIAKERDIKLIHISTDYVFDGKNYKPYVEDDKVNPINFYGKTKLDGENAIKEINPRAIIIRTSWVYSSYGNNFVKTMLRLGKKKDELSVIFDQVGTPTYAKDLASTLLTIMSYELGIMNEKNNNETKNSKLKTKNSVNIYHYSNEGAISWYDFAKEIMKMAKLDCKINPIETYQYPTPAKRPHYSILNKSKIKDDFDIVIPYWKDSLEKMLSERC